MKATPRPILNILPKMLEKVLIVAIHIWRSKKIIYTNYMALKKEKKIPEKIIR